MGRSYGTLDVGNADERGGGLLGFGFLVFLRQAISSICA